MHLVLDSGFDGLHFRLPFKLFRSRHNGILDDIDANVKSGITDCGKKDFAVDVIVNVVYTLFVAPCFVEVSFMAIPLKYLPEPEDPVRLRLVISRKDAKKLAARANLADLSLASYCRGLIHADLAGNVDTEDVIAAVEQFRIVRPVKAVATVVPDKKPGRPRKKAST